MNRIKVTCKYRWIGTDHRGSWFRQGCLLLATVLLLLAGVGCTQKVEPEVTVPSATAGDLRLAVERPLVQVALDQAAIFQAHYPDARLVVDPIAPDQILSSLLKRESGAVLVGGSLTAAEDSLLLLPAYRGRKEPVGRDAVICIVKRSSRVASLSTGTIAMMLSGKRISSAHPLPLVSERNYRLLVTLQDLLHTGNAELHAMQEGSDSLVVARTAREETIVGLLFLSSYRSLRLPPLLREQVRIVPVSSAENDSRAVQPSEQHLFDGSYPLASLVHYIYLPVNPLATGFGSWLSKEGQKGIERSYLAPFRQVPRTIILN